MRLIESQLLIESRHKDGKEWDVVLISAGQSKNGIFYPAKILKAATHLFNNAKSFAYELTPSLYGHLPETVRKILPHGCIKNIVGWFENARFGKYTDNNGREREGILARWHIADNAKWLMELLKDAWKSAKGNLLELSIDADGLTQETVVDGKKITQVTSIKSVNSVDAVTKGAAGGQLIRLVASLEKGGNMQTKFKKLLAEATEINALLTEGINPELVLDEQFINLAKNLANMREEKSKFKERLGFYSELIDTIVSYIEKNKSAEALKALEMLKEKLLTYGYAYPVYEKPSEEYPTAAKEDNVVDAKIKEQEEALKKREEKLIRRENKLALKDKLTESGLPNPIMEKLEEDFDNGRFKIEDLETIIKREKEIVSKLSESGKIKDCGDVQVGNSETEKLKKAMLGMVLNEDIDGVPRFRSLHESFRRMTGVAGSQRHMGHVIHKQIALALPGDAEEEFDAYHKRVNSTRFKEALVPSDWAEYFGDSCRRALMKAYATPDFQTWRQVVSEISSVPDLRTNRRIRIGGFSGLPKVNPGAAYTDLTTPADEEQTYAVEKFGALFKITLESIINDDLGYIKTMSKRLGLLAARDIFEAVFDIFVNNPTMDYDSVALFDAAHNNLDTQALSYSTLFDAITAMRKQTELTSGKRLAIWPRFLLTPIDLEKTTDEILSSNVKITTNEDSTVATALRKYNITNISVPHWTDTNDWVLAADPRTAPTIEVGFLGGKEDPDLFVADQPYVGENLSNDIIVWKVRHFWGVTPLDHRSFFKNVVA